MGRSKPGYESPEQEKICIETIDRFQRYIEEQLGQNNGGINMEMEKVEIKNTESNAWDNIGGGFVKVERDKAKILLVQNWKVEPIEKFKDDKGELKKQIEFSCDVLTEDGQTVNKKYNTTSYSALRSLKEIFYLRQNNAPVLIRIKKIGDGKSTIYDIEEIRTK
jgi:hypothetical protein